MEMLTYLVFIHLGHLAQFFAQVMVRGTFMSFEIQYPCSLWFWLYIEIWDDRGGVSFNCYSLFTSQPCCSSELILCILINIILCIIAALVIMYIFIFRQLKTRPLWKLIQTILILFILKMINTLWKWCMPLRDHWLVNKNYIYWESFSISCI